MQKSPRSTQRVRTGGHRVQHPVPQGSPRSRSPGRKAAFMANTHTHPTAYKPVCDKCSTTKKTVWSVGWVRDIRKPYLPNAGISFFLSSSVQRPGHYSEVISVPLKLDLFKGLLLACLSYCGQLSQPGCKGGPSPQNLKPSKLGQTSETTWEGSESHHPGLCTQDRKGDEWS